MTFIDSIKSCLDKYATFRGRAPRSEYWWFWTFYILTEFVTMIVFGFIGYLCGDVAGMMIAGYIGAFLSSLMLFLPMLSVFVRRLHDTNHSGWWYFIAFVPLIGGIWLLVLLLTDSDEENEYGLPVY
jgi:uncharacterized membrane protein YhaH (DUF805 family)